MVAGLSLKLKYSSKIGLKRQIVEGTQLSFGSSCIRFSSCMVKLLVYKWLRGVDDDL